MHGQVIHVGDRVRHGQRRGTVIGVVTASGYDSKVTMEYVTMCWCWPVTAQTVVTAGELTVTATGKELSRRKEKASPVLH